MIAIFSYGFELATTNFEKSNVELAILSDYENLLEQALESNYISEKELLILQKWRKNPSQWTL